MEETFALFAQEFGRIGEMHKQMVKEGVLSRTNMINTNVTTKRTFNMKHRWSVNRRALGTIHWTIAFVVGVAKMLTTRGFRSKGSPTQGTCRRDRSSVTGTVTGYRSG